MGPPLQALLASYLVGAIPTAYLVVWRLKRVDVRTVGSGNVGATNVARTAGLKAGLVVFLIDAVKGAVAVRLIAPWLLPAPDLTWRLACGLAAVLGHDFPVFLGFRGGKGVATTMGVLLAAAPTLGGVCAAVWVAVFVPWRFVSVASMAAAAALPVTQAVAGVARGERWAGAALAVLLVLRHHANIRRLLQGTEHRAGSKKG